MSLMKRGAIWWAYFSIDGVRHQVSTGTTNRRHAGRIEMKLKDDANFAAHNLTQADPEMTFGALAARFIANAGPRPHHLDRLKHLLPFFADVPVGRITKPLVREYRQARHAQKTMCDATINRDVAVLRHLLYWGLDEGLLAINPLTRLRLVPERRSPRPVLTMGEELRLLTAAPPHLADMIVVALDTGMRLGEILHQRWEHVDLTRGVLLVSQSKTVQGEGREIPLSRRVRCLLERRQTSEGTLFVYRRHAITTSIKTAWRTTLKSAAIRHIRFHDLRHAFNTRLLEAGVLQEVRKALMGHTSGAGVHGQYTHVELPLKREAIAKLEAWLETHTPQPPTITHTQGGML
jgi:integrase